MNRGAGSNPGSARWRWALLAGGLLIACIPGWGDEAAAGEGGVFALGIKSAQQRCVKLFGGSIAREHGYATGIVVSAEGHILTAEGIYLSGSQIRVVLPDGSAGEAKVLKQSDTMHVALLQMEKRWPFYFDLADRSPAEKGDWVLAVANPFKVADGAEELSVNLGIISMSAGMETKRKRRTFSTQDEMIVIDAITGNPGSPGGALVGVDGKLVGMIGRVMESMGTLTRLNYAVPAGRLKAFVDGEEAVAKVEEAPRREPFVGLQLFALSGKKAPAYIDRVMPDSPAAKAGLKKDDLVMAIGSRAVRNCREYKEIESDLTPGEDVYFVIKRKTEIVRVTLKVGEKEQVGEIEQVSEKDQAVEKGQAIEKDQVIEKDQAVEKGQAIEKDQAVEKDQTVKKDQAVEKDQTVEKDQAGGKEQAGGKK